MSTPVDEWDTARLDVDAYLARIGRAEYRDAAPTGETLRALHRAHIASIPFGNVDVLLGRGASPVLDDVVAKLVDARGGGYCFEHSILFAAALEHLGFRVERLLGRVGDVPARPRPRTHMTLHVHADDGEWLADVGFGAGALDPLPFDDSGWQTQEGWRFALQPRDDGWWQMVESVAGEPLVQHLLPDVAQHASDIAVANHYTATHPHSPFVHELVVMRREPDVLRQLVNRTLTLRRPDGSSSERRLDDADLAAALRDEFRVPVSDADVDGLAHVLGPVG